MNPTETDTPMPAKATREETIGSWLPSHTHRSDEPTGCTAWRWTTPDGSWNITLQPKSRKLILGSRVGELTFELDDRSLHQAHDVLVSLDAIAPAAAHV